MTLTLYSHPLASYCHKVLIALYEAGTPFEAVTVDLGDPAAHARLLELWPVGKIPVLRDAARGVTLPEASIIIEHLDLFYPGPRPLLPADPETRLQARLWDRFFDLYVQGPMQKIVFDSFRPEAQKDRAGVEEAMAQLLVAYDLAERHLAGRTWAAGEEFGIADCAAAPALFFAGILHPFGEGHGALRGYFERLVARPSFRRVLLEAQPWFDNFPFRDRMEARFLSMVPD
ncbi:glutathione S-transferase family protein [Salipiger sp. H15]|uniref:Glutathione S-transferase family protein n=1 Tax=Alloyangia sp. H15 TaxID=3029062 RepID=A0AAU8ANP2_9RHOB